jgi:hypothetical protein
MTSCVQDSAVAELASSVLQEFEEEVAKVPANTCYKFNSAARTLEAQLGTIYRLIAICARDVDELEAVAKLWGLMAGVCDQFAKTLGDLKTEHPDCGADVYYDRILDLRNKCVRLREMHA